ncbi:MAG: LamG-like jellyroll fold domain-containing protein [Verrucomicrobiales bacterium]
MKKTATIALAMAAVITGECAVSTQPVPPSPNTAPQGGTFNLDFSKPAGNLGSLSLGKVLFSRPGNPAESFHHSREALLIKDRYIVILDNSATTGIHWNWKGAENPLAIFLTHPEGKTLKPKDKSLQQLVLKQDENTVPGNIAIIATAPGLKVNGVSGKPGLTLASGINHQMAVAQTDQGIDRIFWGSNNKRARLNSTGWAVNSHSAIIREIGNNTTQLAAFGGSGKSNNLIATRLVTLEIEGHSVAVEATVSSPPQNAGKDPAVITVHGNYMAEKGAKLRLSFGAPTQEITQQHNRLLAFWKFDEGTGTTAVDLKSPLRKAQLINADPKHAWTKGVGFGDSKAVALNDGAHIETAYVKNLQGNNSIAIWVKTKAGCLLASKVAQEGQSLLPGSRMIEITPEGEVKVTLVSLREETIKSTVKVNDGKWHHIAWAVEEQPDEGLRIPLAAEHRLYIDAKLQGSRTIKHPYGSEPIRTPLKIGAAITYTQDNGKIRKIGGLTGTLDNIRIYNFPLTEKQLRGFHMVGILRSPFLITSEPRKTVRVGERFNYAIQYTGVPFAEFTIKPLPEWIKFEGILTGIPTTKDIGVSKRIAIVGMSTLGPEQQLFAINVLPPLVTPEWKIHVDGKPVPTRYTGLGIEADLPPGRGGWVFTNKNPGHGK